MADQIVLDINVEKFKKFSNLFENGAGRASRSADYDQSKPTAGATAMRK